MWKQIKALILLVFFMFFVFNSFFYTPPTRNYTKQEVEEINKQEREKKYAYNNTSINDNNQSMNQNSSMNETASEEEIKDIQFEFPSDDIGEKLYSEEELLNKIQSDSIIEDFIESDAEKKTEFEKVEEYEYYYEYIYEETNNMNLPEENIKTYEDSQVDFMDQTFQTKQNPQELFLNDKDTLQNDSDFNNNIQDSQQRIQIQQDLSQNQSELSKYTNQTINQNYDNIKEEEEYYEILEEEEINVDEENQEQFQNLSDDYNDKNDKQDNPIETEFNKINKSINQESQISQQNSNQFFILYFDLICFKDHNTIEQEQIIPQSIKIQEQQSTLEINPILFVHTIILTLLLIFVIINDKQNINIKKEQIQQTNISQLSELNEYMSMMMNRLEQQYNFIAQSQEQLAYQLELLEQ